MQTTEESLASVIAERLRESPEIRPFPAAVARLTAACQDPDANSKQFEAIIECDAGISGRILRLANSPLFGIPGRVQSIAHAVSLLGLRRLKSIAITVAGVSMFSSGDKARRQRHNLWQHSLGCAVIARELAPYFEGVEPDEAFLAGIFHDIGKLFFYDMIPDEYSRLDASYEGKELVAEEEQLFDTTHQRVGLASANAWELPLGITAAIGWHHCPEQAEFELNFATITNMANRLAKHWKVGPLTTEGDEELLAEVAKECGLTNDQLEEMEENSRIGFEEIASLID